MATRVVPVNTKYEAFDLIRFCRVKQIHIWRFARIYKKTMKNCRFLKFWVNRVLIRGILKCRDILLRKCDVIIILLEKEFRKL